jgi:hypothetical protein
MSGGRAARSRIRGNLLRFTITPYIMSIRNDNLEQFRRKRIE